METDTKVDTAKLPVTSRSYCVRLQNTIANVSRTWLVTGLAIATAATLVASAMAGFDFPNLFVLAGVSALILFAVFAETGCSALGPRGVVTLLAVITFFPVLALLALVDAVRPIPFQEKKTPLIYLSISLVIAAIILKFRQDVAAS